MKILFNNLYFLNKNIASFIMSINLFFIISTTTEAYRYFAERSAQLDKNENYQSL